MKKALMYASVASMIQQFNMPNIKLLQSLGYQVDVACNFEFGSTIGVEKIKKMQEELKLLGVKYYQINIPRKISDIHNIKLAYGETKKILNENNYDLIHCHSPIGGVLARMAYKNSRLYRKTKMIYTAHGFHFFNGAPLINWFLFYPIEKYLSKYVDVLITINSEDYKRAKKSFRAGRVIQVPGVGICYEEIVSRKISPNLRNDLNLTAQDYIIVSVGELCDRKNHSTIIKAIKKINNDRLHYLIVGTGGLENQLKQEIKELELTKNIHLLGYRTDIADLCKISNAYVFPSKREGLGLAAIEGMAAGLPILTSNVNGINEYSVNGITGFSYSPLNMDGFVEGITWCMNHQSEAKAIGDKNIERAKKFSIQNVNKIMYEIYSKIS